MTGVDFSAKAVHFCKRNHRLEGLSFLRGDAESLPLAAESFDAVLNVESSHCYGSMPAFLCQVKRVLRPGGHFLFADLRNTVDRERLHQNIVGTGMTLLIQQDVTANVVEALRRDSERKLALIERNNLQPSKGRISTRPFRMERPCTCDICYKNDSAMRGRANPDIPIGNRDSPHLRR
jgi:ubiquinone/menaquinone biosynthesis C-methylase UbiE